MMNRIPTGLWAAPAVAMAIAGAVAAGQAGTWADTLREERARQHQDLSQQLPRKAWFAKVAAQTFRQEALILEGDRDPLDVVLRRTRALLDDLKKSSAAAPLAPMEAELSALAAKAQQTGVEGKDARRALFDDACTLRRRIAFANPLLDFGQIAFVKQQLPSIGHMCDQFFGCFAQPGGGLFVLEKPFGAEPVARDLLGAATLSNGRLKGKKLEGGCFMSPALSYNAGTLLFAYTECGLGTPRPAPRGWFRDAEWSPELSYHIFRVNADGSGLTQLTDGAWNDIHPWWLPDGRVVFMSERRGGFGRCHARPVPIYTLHAMDADGRNLVRLSSHESNEWFPSVNHDGMVVYTRWDYVDRGFNQAHHPWITTPDGRDPRIIQGNYKKNHDDGPNMEMGVVAIPGSRRYVAVAAAHHNITFGSLIVIEPSLPDDDAMGQVKRLTPDNGLPETGEQGGLVYGTAWPLSETYHLCTHRPGGKGQFGLYLLDAFGNRELLYEDPKQNCISPIAVKARPVPPVVPAVGEPVRLMAGYEWHRLGDQHFPDPSCAALASPAVMSVINVYDCLYAFPEGVKIKALRIIQLLPKSAANHHEPQIGYGSETNARRILGTVPVEADGSASFRLPPAVPVYFQALDERGLAVQSMRSATYARGGERLVCAGCHEPKSQASAKALEQSALAFRRAPSEIQPEVEGSNPFSFPRLVQPVLDAHCVKCHQKTPEKAPDLRPGNWHLHPFRWYDSYRNLLPFAFHYGATRNVTARDQYDGWQPSRTVPGKFGARASKLLAILDKGHYDVKLPPEALRRLTLWLDANSDFFGSYENFDVQAAGQRVPPPME